MIAAAVIIGLIIGAAGVLCLIATACAPNDWEDL